MLYNIIVGKRGKVVAMVMYVKKKELLYENKIICKGQVAMQDLFLTWQ